MKELFTELTKVIREVLIAVYEVLKLVFDSISKK